MFSLKDPTSLIKIHLTSKMRNTPPEWLIYNELNQMERSNVLRTVSAIDPCWLFEIAPHYFADLNAWPAGLVQQRLRNAKTTYELEHFNQILKL
jgi:ATP-dependent RNA helicase DDX35